jgi:uncharacterized protein (TIGR03000 family)
MPRQLLSVGLCAAAALAITAGPARVQAQSGLYPGYRPPAYPSGPAYNPGINRYSGFVPYPGYSPAYNPGFARTYARIAPTTPPAAPGPSRFYVPSPEEGGAAQADNTALITVYVPSGATVWFDGWQASLTGPVRKFQSPALTPGRQYAYTVRARWEEDGREVTQTRDVTVSPGAHVQVTFPTPSGTEKPGAVPKSR